MPSGRAFRRERQSIPELPEVQVFKEYVDATSLHRKVEDVEVEDGRELKTGASTLTRRLSGHSLSRTRRHGKHLFLGLGEGNGWLRLHFGMTGGLRAWDGEPDEEPDHVRLLLSFADARRLAYTCQRRFGEIGFTHDPDDYVESEELGPDLLDPELDGQGFLDLLSSRRGQVKGALMDQELVAGLGTVYSDETLFQAEIDPRASVPGLDDDERTSLFRAARRIVRRAVDRRAEPDRMPDAWLIRRREEGRACSRCDGEILKTEVSGRPTYLCSRHQAGSRSS